MSSEYKISRKNVLGVEIIIVEGEQGIGKTSFVASLLCQDYKYHGKERTKLAHQFSMNLNNNYGYNLHINNRHLYFSNISIFLDKHLKVPTWCCDFTKFAIPNDSFEVDYIPPYSVIFFTEIDSQAFYRNWQQFSNYYVYLFKYFRHMHYTIIMDSQVGDMVEKALRTLTTRRIYVYQSRTLKSPIIKRVKGKITKFISTKPQLLEFSRVMRKLEGSLSIGKVEKMHHKYKGNIFKHYNSFSGVPYFLYKIKDWTFRTHEETDLSPEGVNRYVKLHPLAGNNNSKKEKSNGKTRQSTATAQQPLSTA